jgi:putative sigma-54 modulation protein
MKFNIRGSKDILDESVKNYIETKIGKLDKYFENPDEITANILVKESGIKETIEVTIPIKKAILRAEDSNKDIYAAIDLVLEKLERQIRKNKTKIKHKTNKENIDVFIDFEITEEEEVNDNKIIKRKKVENKPMDEEEAILQMDLLGHDFFIFKNISTDNVAVVYRRKDGDYGIIEMI